MKRSSFQRLSVTNAHRILRLRLGVAFAAVILVVLLVRLALPNVLTTALTPVWKGGEYLTGAVGVVPIFFSDKISLARENDALRAKNETLTLANAAAAAQLSDLKKLVGTRTQPIGGLLAGVLARPPVIPYDLLIIDAGSEAGVREGNLVEGPGGIPLGVIESTASNSARVLLFSTPGKETAGWVGESRTAATMIGTGAGSMRATIAKDVPVAVGDLVYAAGPGAIPFGTIARIDTNPSSPQAVLHIQMYTNLFSLTWVTVVP